MKSHFAREIVGSVRDSGNLGHVPAFSFILVRDPNDGSVSLHRQKIENSIVVRISDSNRFYERQSCRQRTLTELPLPLIHKDVQLVLRRR